MRSKRIKINKKTYIIQPMNAKDGLEAIIKMAPFIEESAPYLAVLAHKRKQVRITALAKAAQANVDVPALLFDLISLGSTVPIEELEQMPLPDLLKLLKIIMRMNKWDALWKAAYSLRLVDEKKLAAWIWSSLVKQKVE